MKLYIYDKHAKVADLTSSQLSKLIQEFSLYVPGYQYTSSYKNRTWDGKKEFISKTGRFLPGLSRRVAVACFDLFSIHPEIIDNRTNRPEDGVMTFGEDSSELELRPYQEAAVESLVSGETGILKAATNAGKTEIAAELIRRLKQPTLFLVHRKELLHQTAKRLQDRLGVSVGRVGDGLADIQDVTVAMPSSMTYKVSTSYFNKVSMRVKEDYQNLLYCPALILDECHTIKDSRIQAVVSESVAYYRFAMSGTPLLNDDTVNYTLEGLFGPVLFEISNSELICGGYSSVPECYFIPVEDSIIAMDYQDAYAVGITGSMVRNELIVDTLNVLKKNNYQILVVVREIEHGQSLQLLLEDAVFIHGSMDSSYRMESIERFKKSEITTLISSTILDEGVNIPNIDVLVLAASGKTPKRLLQRIGRGLRKKLSNRLIVIDFLDTHNKYLLEHSVARYETMKAEGFRTKLIKNLSSLP